MRFAEHYLYRMPCNVPMIMPSLWIKTGCIEAYPPPDISALLLSNSYHPDSATLTRRLADQLGLRAG
ncbi:hypothetical protein A8144_05760 [Mycobacterium leprae 3125609]|nr:hypothetical protein A8144_05760 [Mycobacterium leprae 3125609]